MLKQAIFLFIFLFWIFPVQAKGLENLALEDCVRIALSRHPDIAIAEALVREKAGEVKEVKSGVYPSLLGTGSYTHVSPTLFAGFGPFNFPIEAENSFSIGLSVRYSIFNGGRLQNRVREAKLALSGERWNLKKVMLDKVLDVKRAFYHVLLGEEQIRSARWLLNSAQFNEATSLQLYRTGAAPRIVFLNARIRKKEAAEILSNARASYAKALDNLAVAIGLKPGDVESVKGILSAPALPPFSGLLEMAYESRPEIKKDMDEIKKAKTGIEIAKATDLPDISIVAGNFFLTRPFIPFVSAYQNQAGVQVTWPFEWGKEEGRELEAEAKLKSAEARLLKDKNEISLELSAAYSDAAQAQKDIRAYSENVAESRKSFEDALAAFANGLISSTQLDETQDLSSESQTNYLISLYKYNEALARLSYLLGEEK